jgi:hypothetical protein
VGVDPYHSTIVREAKEKLTEQREHPRNSRSAGIFASLLIVAIGVGMGTAQARKKEAEEPRNDLAGKVASLGKQLYGQDIDDVKPLTDEIQKLVVGHLTAWIADRSPNIVQVRHELDQAFSKLQYPAVGTPSIFITSWKNMELIGAGYTLGWSDIWRVNVLVIYENYNGHTHGAAITHFVPRTDLHYAILPPSATGDFRFLTYGWRLGMSHPRLSAVLYLFDGKNLQSQWETEDLFDGKLSINNKALTISYLDENEYVRQTQMGQLPPRHEKIYKITPQGVQFETERDLPYQ